MAVSARDEMEGTPADRGRGAVVVAAGAGTVWRRSWMREIERAMVQRHVLPMLW